MVSIVIPAYDRADLLKQTIESIQKQKEINYEIIIIDDNSDTDEIYNICKKYNIIYHKNNQNYGAQISRNKGVELSKYDYIAFIDSDDLWLDQNKLKKQYEILKLNKNISLVFTNLIDIDINGNYIKKNILKTNNNILNNNFQKIILTKDIVATYSSVMIRKKDFLSCGQCNINLPARQDWDLWIRLSKLGGAHILDNSYTLYRIHDNQISSGIDKKLDGFSKLLIIHKKYFFEKKLKRIFYQHLFKLIFLQKISQYNTSSYNLVYKENKLFSTVCNILITIVLSIPFFKKIIIQKISTLYLFRGLV